MLALKEDEKQNEIKRKEVTSKADATITDLYNALQHFFAFMAPKFILFDIRNSERFNESHIVSAVNIDCTKLLDKDLDVESLKFQNLTPSRGIKDSHLKNKAIWIYHDDTNYDDKAEETLQCLLENTAKIASFHVVNKSFSAFKRKYPFLCIAENQDDDDVIPEDYPNEVIVNKVYLGDFNHAKNWDAIKYLKITHVINATTNIPNHFEEHGVAYLNVKVDDEKDAEINEHFEQTNKFLDDVSDKDECRVLVHCQMGVSRSATIVIAYVMHRNGCSFDEAFKLVKNCRICIRPNAAFEAHLREYEKVILAKKMKENEY